MGLHNEQGVDMNRDDVQKWCDESGILTVGKLRELLAGMDDLTQIVMHDNNGDTYLNIPEVLVADDENPAVTLFTGSFVSPIQF
jgi:hypothetical protein